MRHRVVAGVVGALVAVAACGGEESRASRFPIVQGTDPVDDEVDYGPRTNPDTEAGDGGAGDTAGGGGGGDPQDGNARRLYYGDDTSWW